jgi:hypothetical protein
MARTWRNRTVGYDNIAIASVYGLENISLANATPPQDPFDNITSGTVQTPENKERLLNAAGTSINISVAASGLEKLTP